MASENNNTTDNHGHGQSMTGAEEIADDETSPYLEIIEDASLHPVTRCWEVPRENVIIQKIIGKGTFGQVAQGKVLSLHGVDETTTVAIKMLKGISMNIHTVKHVYLRFSLFKGTMPPGFYYLLFKTVLKS